MVRPSPAMPNRFSRHQAERLQTIQPLANGGRGYFRRSAQLLDRTVSQPVHLLQKLLVALFDQDSHENCRSTSDLPVHFWGSAGPIPERPYCSLGRRFLTTAPVKIFFSHCPICFRRKARNNSPGNVGHGLDSDGSLLEAGPRAFNFCRAFFRFEFSSFRGETSHGKFMVTRVKSVALERKAEARSCFQDAKNPPLTPRGNIGRSRLFSVEECATTGLP